MVEKRLTTQGGGLDFRLWLGEGYRTSAHPLPAMILTLQTIPYQCLKLST